MPPAIEDTVVQLDEEPVEIEPPVAAQKPKPEIVDAPDTPDEADIAATPWALSALAKVKSLTPAQARAIAPLLAQLRDVHTRISSARKE
jgi:hypothetical protein